MSTHVEGQSYNAPSIKVTDRDQADVFKVEHTESGPVAVPAQEVNKQLDDLATKLAATGRKPFTGTTTLVRNTVAVNDARTQSFVSEAKESIAADEAYVAAGKEPRRDIHVPPEVMPQLFLNLRTILLARDIGDNERISAAKALLHNVKDGSIFASAHAESVLLEVLTHERLRGR